MYAPLLSPIHAVCPTHLSPYVVPKDQSEFKTRAHLVMLLSFYGEELLTPHPSPKLEDHSSSAVCNSIIAATFHIWRLFLHQQPEDIPCHGDRYLIKEK
jgi:hypothetical protein